jgi:hypothetical protein
MLAEGAIAPLMLFGGDGGRTTHYNRLAKQLNLAKV